MADPPSERRKYKRLQAPVYCRPAGTAFRGQQPVEDISVGGFRVYTDDAHKPGRRLEVELFLPEGAAVTLLAEVVWVDELPAGGPAKFEVGLRYVELSQEDEALLERVLQSD